ncbi:MAG: hypothetical protein RR744_00130 [Cellulosilyticaceae bacterium]
MQGIIDRLKVERDELFEKLKKLSIFLDSNPNIDEEALGLLWVQEDAMLAYYSVLVSRIELMENK